MQKVSNPVPRVIHPDWLHKKVREKEDKYRQRKLVDIFSSKDKDDAKGQRAISDSDNNGMGGQNIEDMEDFRTSEKFSATGPRPTVRSYEVNNGKDSVKSSSQVNSSQSTDHSRSAHEMLKTQQQNDMCMKDIDRNSDYQGWLDLKKRKWKEAREKRKRRRLDNAKDRNHTSDVGGTSGGVNQKRTRGKPGFSSYFESEELAPTQCHWQVLWISDNGNPDLGGTNEEDSCYTDEVDQPVLTYPGAYRKVSVELKIHHLAVNALLKSNYVNEMEGGDLFGSGHDSSTGPHNFDKPSGFDEATSCAPAFRVLKQLIQRCLADAVTSGNVFADAILQHLYRWLCRYCHLGTYLSGLSLNLRSSGILCFSFIRSMALRRIVYLPVFVPIYVPVYILFPFPQQPQPFPFPQ